jgi:hypothetical protein
MEQRILAGKSDLTDLIEEEFVSDLSSRIHKGNLSQLDIAKFNHDNPHAMLDGMGEIMLSIDPDVYHAVRMEMKQEMKDPSYECWEDADFCKFVWKNHPEYRGVNQRKIVSSKGLVA